ncbi:hypothetical protein [Coraliomargarita akajimensis]|uniref:hypothetical protein n=1 Tax=Coraliomargarita akajimensis TaxID=395922 RepID=UPI0005A1569F|nr:hypothetical protein [Coraliomargarita akajimensis]
MQEVSAHAAFYDPDGVITSTADLLGEQSLDPALQDSVMWDYDGDGVDNLTEYLRGTDPTDFFNGETVTIRAYKGDGQVDEPNVFLLRRLYASVHDSEGAEIVNAPVRIRSVGGPYLSRFRNASDLHSTVYDRTVATFGASTAYFTPATDGSYSAIADLPDGTSVTFSVFVVSEEDKQKEPIRNFEVTDNGDNTTTYTWTSDADSGDWLRLQEKNENGTWSTFFNTTYGSSVLPYRAGQTDYSLTLDENNQVVSQ